MTRKELTRLLESNGFTSSDGKTYRRNESQGINVTLTFKEDGLCRTEIYHYILNGGTTEEDTIDDTYTMLSELFII